jgi:lipopolysaccharide heptosyltransferase I
MSALGDVVHALPSLAALRQLYPAAEISWLVEPLGAKLLEGHPQIDRLYVAPRQAWKRRLRNPLRWPGVLREIFRLGRELRRQRFDLVIDFQCNLRSAVALCLAGGRRRLGFHREDVAERGGALFTNHRARRMPPRLNKVEKNLALVRELGFRGECPPGVLRVGAAEAAWARSFIPTLAGSGPVVVVHPAVSRFGEFKRWPAESFRELIDLLRQRHDARIAITWGPDERETAEAIGRPTVLPEAITLKELAALLEAADLVIAADTGALPMAALVGTPTVGLYGPKDPIVYGPYPRRGEIVSSTAPCSPCRLRSCEHRICMTLISPRAALEKAERALESRSSRP